MLLDDYTTWCRAAGHSPATIKLRVHWLTRAAHELDLATATPHDLIRWLADHDWSAETRKSARAALCSFYRWAYAEEHLDYDPTVRLPAVRVPAGIPRPAPTSVLRRALNDATQRDELILGLAAFAGMRRAEISRARWDDIQWDGIRVTGKGGRVRCIPLSDTLRALLEAERGRRAAGQLGTGWRYRVDPLSPYVLPSHNGEHIAPDTVGEVLSQRLGSFWTGHTLRHRFATKAYAVDRDLLTVQQLMGHSKPETTARYTKAPDGAAVAAVRGAAA